MILVGAAGWEDLLLAVAGIVQERGHQRLRIVNAELLPDCWVAEAVFWLEYSPLGTSLTCHVDRWSGTVRWLVRMSFEALAPPSLGTPLSHPFPHWTHFDRVTSLERITPP